jgi:hypothetical protein
MSASAGLFYEQCLRAGAGGEVYTWSEGVVDVDVKLLLKASAWLGGEVEVALTDGSVVLGKMRPQGAGYQLEREGEPTLLLDAGTVSGIRRSKGPVRITPGVRTRLSALAG